MITENRAWTYVIVAGLFEVAWASSCWANHASRSGCSPLP